MVLPGNLVTVSVSQCHQKTVPLSSSQKILLTQACTSTGASMIMGNWKTKCLEADGRVPFPLRLWSNNVVPFLGTPRRGQSHLAPPGASILGSSLRRAWPPQPSLVPPTRLGLRPKPIWQPSCLQPAGELPLGGCHFLRYYCCCRRHRCCCCCCHRHYYCSRCFCCCSCCHCCCCCCHCCCCCCCCLLLCVTSCLLPCLQGMQPRPCLLCCLNTSCCIT